MSSKLKYLWYIWTKAIGDKAHISVVVSDRVAIIRTLLVLSYLVTNAFIIAGIVHHW